MMITKHSLYRLAKQPLLVFLIAVFMVGCGATPKNDPRATPESGGILKIKPEVTTNNAMVVAAHPKAVDAGVEILKTGGSSVDAFIATQLVLNLVEPQSSGIGGGGFLVLYNPETKAIETYDGRETAPSGITENLFMKEDGNKMGFFDAAVGGKAVGVPGLVSMMEKAHQEHGKLPWKDLFEPAITLAENGFEVTERFNLLSRKDRFLKTDPTSKDYFYDEEGKPWPVGHILKNPEFAETLRQIQTGGAFSFYIGQIADQIVEKVQSHPTNPGLMDFMDLQKYQVIKREPVCKDYLSYEVCGMAPPSSGGLGVAQILGILEQYQNNNSAQEKMFGPHVLAEASKLAFSDRNFFVADPDFFPVPIKGMLNSAYLIGRSTLIQDDSSLKTPVAPGGPFLYGQKLAPDTTSHGISTTHISIMDKDGMALSMTSSIENAYGSRQMVGGFLLNNQLTDFSFLPEKDGVKIANRAEPNKRPRSSMAPTIVLDKETQKPVLIVGSPGGSRIIGYVAKTIYDVLGQKKSLTQSLIEGHMTNRNGSTDIEENSPYLKHAEALKKLGHDVKTKTMTSGIHVIEISTDGQMTGAADPRREGIVLGY